MGAAPGVEESQTWPLWGGRAQLVVRRDPDGASASAVLAAARAAVDHVVAAVDDACSRFRPDSEVSRLAAADGDAVPISPVLADALRVALRAARLTDGAVDPTLGTALVAIGYDRDLADIPADRPGTLPRLTRRPLWRDVDLAPDGLSVRVPAGVLLDLGATAKAFAADRAAQAAYEAVGLPLLVNLGGDLAVAGTDPAQPWPVRVAERPDDADGPVVNVYDGGVATSTTRVRRWALSGQPVHHLLDPVTGLPVREHWRTVTVAAATCVDANTASTATVVKGLEGRDWLIATGLPARLVAGDGSVQVLGGWPADPTVEASA